MTMNAQEDVFPEGEVVMEGGKIVRVGPAGEIFGREDEIIDCKGTAILPGLVNVHTHACIGFFRGLAEDVSREYWSTFYRLPYQDRFTREDYVLSAEASCYEMLLNGVTCIADRFSFMDAVGDAIEATGIRAIITYTLSDADGPADWETALRVIEHWGTSPEKRVSAGIGPHALNTCSDALLKKSGEISVKRSCRVFVHVAQSEAEVRSIRERGYRGALDCLRNVGLMGDCVVAAHCIYLSEEELARWPETGIAVAHCPASNAKVEARTAAVVRLKSAGVHVGLGTDWAPSNNAMDLFLEMRWAGLLGKVVADDPTCLTTHELLRMATIEGARVLGLDGVTGSLEPDKRGDVIVIDLMNLRTQPVHDVTANLVYSATGAQVRDVFVDGVLLVRNGGVVSGRDRELVEELERLRWKVCCAQGTVS